MHQANPPLRGFERHPINLYLHNSAAKVKGIFWINGWAAKVRFHLPAAHSAPPVPQALPEAMGARFPPPWPGNRVPELPPFAPGMLVATPPLLWLYPDRIGPSSSLPGAHMPRASRPHRTTGPPL